MRGTAVNDLQEEDIENCVELIAHEDFDAASTSYNLMEGGKWGREREIDTPGRSPRWDE